jgi:amidase
MAVHTFRPTRYHRTFGPHEPVLRVADGDTIVTTTVDASGRDHLGDWVTEGGNPQTGPFYVEGARRGDTLVVSLDRLAPNRSIGISSASIAPHVLDPEDIRSSPVDDVPAQWNVDAAAGTATLVAPDSTLGRLVLPLAPMLGCFGVAPDTGQVISTETAGTHGGNMDYRGFSEGTSAYFPVFTSGGLLFVGDGHALQADGEILGTGVEISLAVRFTVRIIRGKQSRWPRGETTDAIFAVGIARPLDQALQHATSEMLRWLQDDYALDARGAQLLLGHSVEYDVGNVYDPAYTIACKVPKRILKQLR